MKLRHVLMAITVLTIAAANGTGGTRLDAQGKGPKSQADVFGQSVIRCAITDALCHDDAGPYLDRELDGGDADIDSRLIGGGPFRLRRIPENPGPDARWFTLTLPDLGAWERGENFECLAAPVDPAAPCPGAAFAGSEVMVTSSDTGDAGVLTSTVDLSTMPPDGEPVSMNMILAFDDPILGPAGPRWVIRWNPERYPGTDQVTARRIGECTWIVEADETAFAGLFLDFPNTGKGNKKSDNISYEGRMPLPFQITFTAANCMEPQ